jgi:glycosyltransferase involved in cell wall biosynthesis
MQVILCVTNDVVADQRVCRVAASLLKWPARVLVVGRKRGLKMDTSHLPFDVLLMHLWFRRGPFFYAEYNLRLFFLLLFRRADILVSNDLDTLPAVYLAARLKKAQLMYDSHEFFTEVPELLNRPIVQKIWRILESFLLPRVKYATTVSQSLAARYFRLYDIQMTVIRNLPNRFNGAQCIASSVAEHRKIIFYQGALNKGRGLELMIEAMVYLPGAVFMIAGTGDIEKDLRRLVVWLQLQDRVIFLGRLMPGELLRYTVRAQVGISLEEPLGLSYTFALPNKLFDYIQARIPVIVSDLPEMSSVVKQYHIGVVLTNRDPKMLADMVGYMLNRDSQRQIWMKNLDRAAEELCWENEEPRLLALYRDLVGE